MKKSFSTPLVLSFLLGSLVILNGGCSKPTIPPPDSTVDGTSGDLSSGNDINYPLAETGYSESNVPAEGTLDDSTPKDVARDSSIDKMPDEYKEMNGRCSPNLSPVYFDFDQAGIRPDMVEVMNRNGDYLSGSPSLYIIIQGNSDERGTNEYNVALGERRAINAQQYLINLGIEPYRIRTVSFGEEKPLFMGQDESAYQMNRRVDFVVE